MSDESKMLMRVVIYLNLRGGLEKRRNPRAAYPEYGVQRCALLSSRFGRHAGYRWSQWKSRLATEGAQWLIAITSRCLRKSDVAGRSERFTT